MTHQMCKQVRALRKGYYDKKGKRQFSNQPSVLSVPNRASTLQSTPKLRSVAKVHMANEQGDNGQGTQWYMVENNIGSINYAVSVYLVYNLTMNTQ